MHRLLERQLSRKFGKEHDRENFSVELQAFLDVVSETYENYDKERRLLENTIELNSQELYAAKKSVEEKNNALQSVNSLLEEKVEERTKELLIQKRNAEHANETKTRFLANMSHELRTPLNAIIGFSQILQMQLHTEDKSRPFIGKINIAGQNMLVLVNTLLDFAKVEDGKVVFAPKEVAIVDITSELSILFEHQTSVKAIKLTLPDLEKTQTIVADAQLLKQVFINLLSNAVKFSPDNSEVILSYEKREEKHVFAVQDFGDGISQEELQTLFQPFVQGKSSQNLSLKGSGLGLSLVKKIIEEIHGGKVWCDSALGEGSKFIFEIPADIKKA